MTTADLIAESVDRLFLDECGPARIRAINGGTGADALWRTIEEAGFADSLTAEARGGHGLGLRDIRAIPAACGRHGLAAPVMQTIVARAVLADAGVEVPSGLIAVAPRAGAAGDGAIAASQVAGGLAAQWMVLDCGGESLLVPRAEVEFTPTGLYGSLQADVTWRGGADVVLFPCPVDWLAVMAGMLAAQMAGALEQVLSMTIRFANDRIQFGRPISKFQVIQHQISVMAEQVFAARMAADICTRADGHLPDATAAAIAKARIGEAAPLVCAIGHSIHGAIGITEEYDLQLYTRRLHEWRLAAGSEACWQARLGEAVLAADAGSSLDFVRRTLPS